MYLVFMTLLLGLVQCLLVYVLFVSNKAGFLGGPGRVGDPLIVEYGSAEFITPGTGEPQFLYGDR